MAIYIPFFSGMHRYDGVVNNNEQQQEHLDSASNHLDNSGTSAYQAGENIWDFGSNICSVQFAAVASVSFTNFEYIAGRVISTSAIAQATYGISSFLGYGATTTGIIATSTAYATTALVTYPVFSMCAIVGATAMAVNSEGIMNNVGNIAGFGMNVGSSACELANATSEYAQSFVTYVDVPEEIEMHDFNVHVGEIEVLGDIDIAIAA